jgi:hypothetical protein
MYALAQCYETGDGTIPSTKQAFEWYQKAAGEGIAEAYQKLANCYIYGIGTMANSKNAIESINMALALEYNCDFLFTKGELFSVLKDRQNSIKIYNEINKACPKYFDNTSAKNRNTNFFKYIERMKMLNLIQ